MRKNISRRDVLKTIGLTSVAAPTLMDFTFRNSDNVPELAEQEKNSRHKDFEKNVIHL